MYDMNTFISKNPKKYDSIICIKFVQIKYHVEKMTRYLFIADIGSFLLMPLGG